jgi:hypothetical protein
VLVTAVENHSGDPLLDGTLQFALERELAGSRHVNVASRERVADTLLLMRRPTSTPLDLAIGREVALRDGAIRALVTGRVEKAATSTQSARRLSTPETATSSPTSSNRPRRRRNCSRPSPRLGSDYESDLVRRSQASRLRQQPPCHESQPHRCARSNRSPGPWPCRTTKAGGPTVTMKPSSSFVTP